MKYMFLYKNCSLRDLILIDVDEVWKMQQFCQELWLDVTW